MKTKLFDDISIFLLKYLLYIGGSTLNLGKWRSSDLWKVVSKETKKQKWKCANFWQRYAKRTHLVIQCSFYIHFSNERLINLLIPFIQILFRRDPNGCFWSLDNILFFVSRFCYFVNMSANFCGTFIAIFLYVARYVQFLIPSIYAVWDDIC